MFGLMRACSCHKTVEEREDRRMHYCGTCKSIGRLYGQKARLFLNHDAVFLGELLTALSPQPTPFSSAYVSKNCLALPQRAQIPAALEYAAAANVVLAQFKLLDHVADTGSRLLRMAARTYSQEFRRAQETLARYRFPFADLERLMGQQGEREREPRPTLARLAEPTAAATGLVFGHGAETIGAGNGAVQTIAHLGTRFGEIAYLVDAIKDRKEDTAKGQFNALAATRTTRRRAGQLLATRQTEMIDAIDALPIEERRKRDFAARLSSNLAPYLFMRRRRPDRVIIVRENRGPGCWDAICCCEAIQCGDCCGDCCAQGCCDCMCMGCNILR